MSFRDRSKRADQRGAALIIVLMLVASLAATSLLLTQTMTRTVSQAGAAGARDNAMWALIGAESAAIALLKQQAQARKDVDTTDERWLVEPITFPFDDGLLRATFTDRSACFNINQLVNGASARELTADPKAIRRFGLFVEALGADARTGETLAGSIADFMDSDDTPEPGGAEDYHYAVGPLPYVTSGRRLSDLSELRSVALWTRPIYSALAPHLCVRADNSTFGLINVNTLTEADAPLLHTALDGRVSVSDAERLIQTRPPDGYEEVSAFLGGGALGALNPPLTPEISGRFATYASYIEFYAQVFYSNQMFEMTSLIESTGGGDYRVVNRRVGAKDL